jgi:transposase
MTNKRHRSSRSCLAELRRSAKLLSYWKESKGEIEEFDLSNKHGRSRTDHENKLIVCALYLLLSTYLDFVEQKKMKVRDISWNKIYTEVASKLHVRKYHVIQLHQQLIEDGDILIFGAGDGSKRGPKEHVHRRLNQQQIQSIVDKVDEYHANGQKVTNREIRNFLTLEYNITLSKMAVSKYFKRLGLTWKKVTNKKRSVGEYRRDLLRTFIIEFDKVMTAINRDPENCDVIPV